MRSSDGFKFNLDVSQIIHIPRVDAPRVIARMGSMLNLVTQVLEPTIGNYFRNAAQTSDVIEFLRHRSERQAEARAAISTALTEYNVCAIDTPVSYTHLDVYKRQLLRLSFQILKPNPIQ